MRGFAPFSVFVGILMLGIAISIAASVQTQVNAYLYQMQQKEVQIESAYNTNLFSIDSVTTFAQALRAALYGENFTYSTDLSAVEKSVIKDAAAEFIKAISETTMYVSGNILSTGTSSGTDESLKKAMTVEIDPNQDLIEVKIWPRKGAIPLGEMNVYGSTEDFHNKQPLRTVKYPLFPVDVNTVVYAYIPVQEIQDSINEVNDYLKTVTILVGFVGTKGMPEMMAIAHTTTEEQWADALKVNDKNYPLKAILQHWPVSENQIDTYVPTTLRDKIKTWVTKYLQNKGYDVVGGVEITYDTDNVQTLMPFRKFVCFTGAFADAMVADPLNKYTVCVDVTGGDAVKNVIDKALLQGDYIKLPYTRVKHISLTVQKQDPFKNACIPGGSISPKMHVEADLTNTNPPQNTPSRMDLNPNAKINSWKYDAGTMQSNILGSGYDLEWGNECPEQDLEISGAAPACNRCQYSCNGGTCWAQKCSGRSVEACNTANNNRSFCWDKLNAYFNKCQNWIKDTLGYYVDDTDRGSICGDSINNPPLNYRTESDTCSYCSNHNCGSCSITDQFIYNNPYDWWNGRSGDFLDTSNYAFIFKVEQARDAVKGWIQSQFQSQCQKVLDQELCNDLYTILQSYDTDFRVYVLSQTDNPQQIANKLIDNGGGILSITVVDTKKWDPNKVWDPTYNPWSVPTAAVVYCNNGKCTTVASSP